MQKVIVKSSGLYYNFWDETQDKWIEKNLVDSTIPITWYLNYPIQLTEELSVRKIISLIEPHSDVLDLVMIRDLAGVKMADVIGLTKEHKPEPNTIEPNIVYLVRIAEVIETVQEEEPTNFLNSYPVIIGIKEVDENVENDEVYSLSSIDFLDWCDLPFEIDDYVEYIDPVTEEVLFEGLMNWTLGELISTIISQVSTTMQISQSQVSQAEDGDGPIEMSAVFEWFDKMDKIILR